MNGFIFIGILNIFLHIIICISNPEDFQIHLGEREWEGEKCMDKFRYQDIQKNRTFHRFIDSRLRKSS